MISLNDVIHIHNILIERFGGSKGVRDLGALESALGRPYATFDKIELYPSAVEKAAAIFESVVINHPFVDGNKRTAYVLMKLMLFEYGLDIIANQEDKYKMVIAASSGEFRFNDIRNWIDAKLSNRTA